MKKGTGDDPFISEEETEVTPEQSPTESDTENRASEKIEATERAVSSTITQDNRHSTQETESEHSPENDSTQNQHLSTTGDALPYLAQRALKGKSVKADRDQIPFFLRTEVEQGERELRHAVENQLEKDVSKTDLREAAYVFAQQNPDGVAAILQEWGIDYLK